MSGTPTPRAKPTPAPAVPDALLGQWTCEAAKDEFSGQYTAVIANFAIAWAWHQRDEEVRQARQEGRQEGADEELEGCCEWLFDGGWPILSRRLNAARRPSPPTLRERALAVLRTAQGVEDGCPVTMSSDDAALIREALQQPPAESP